MRKQGLIFNVLNIRNLFTSYNKREILHDVSFDVKNGEVLALIGPNGAGKSTLIRAVSGVIESRGEIQTDGKNFNQMDSMQRARYIAVVPQAISLPPAFSVWETVLMGRTPYLGFLGNASKHDEELVRDSLSRVNALTFSERRVGELSGGEQQRILLARALCQSTPILLLDEPTSHLDLQYQVSLLELIRKLAKENNLAVLVAMHDLNLAARYADRIALMVAGRINAIGTPKEVLQPDLIANAYCLPVQVVKHPFMDVPLVLPESNS